MRAVDFSGKARSSAGLANAPFERRGVFFGLRAGNVIKFIKNKHTHFEYYVKNYCLAARIGIERLSRGVYNYG